MAANDKANDKADDKTDDVSAEDLSRQAMGKGPVSEGGGADGVAVVPAAGGDPDSIARIVKHLPQGLQDRLGGVTPEDVSAERASYGEAVNAARNPQGPRATDGASDEEMANRTGQPIGDGKSTGAPSADDPGSGLREGKLTAGEQGQSTDASEAASRRAAAATGNPGETQVRGRSATPTGRTTTASKADGDK